MGSQPHPVPRIRRHRVPLLLGSRDRPRRSGYARQWAGAWPRGSYRLGHTYGPFGNPLLSVHSVVWDNAPHPLSMSGASTTVSDLAMLTRHMNESLAAFFANLPVAEARPRLTGVWNGWAGNTFWHNHFQFFVPEYEPPITKPELELPEPLWKRDGACLRKLAWPAPIYKITAPSATAAGRLGDAVLAAWRQLCGAERVCYKDFPPEHQLQERDMVMPHTANIYAPGSQAGRTVYIVPRDRRRVHYTPAPDALLPGGHRAQPKRNAGVLEATGTLLVDDCNAFEAMRSWNPRISRASSG